MASRFPNSMVMSFPSPGMDGLRQRQAYEVVRSVLPAQGQQDLKELAAKGVLADHGGDTSSWTTLDYLAHEAVTPRAQGLSNQQTLLETVHLLAHPEDVNQDYVAADRVTLDRLETLQHQAVGQPNHQQPSPRAWHRLDYAVMDSHTCAAAAEVSRLASQHPKQLARLADEASQPGLTMTQAVTPQQLGGGSPLALVEHLRRLNLQAEPQADGSWRVALPVPLAGWVRAVRAQQSPRPFAANGVETLLQSALTYNASKKTYDPAVDRRENVAVLKDAIARDNHLLPQDKEAWQGALTDNPMPLLANAQFQQWLTGQSFLPVKHQWRLQKASQATDVGLKESEEALIQSLMEGGQPWQSVTCQVTQRDVNNPHQLLLAGYTQSFEQTTASILETLLEGHEVIAGITVPNRQGVIQGGHIIKITGYRVEPENQQLMFLVADSDDAHHGLMPKVAADLIPLIHHLTLPAPLAQADWASIRAMGHQFLRPSVDDTQWFRPVAVTRQPYPEGRLLPGETPEDYWRAMAAQQAMTQTATAASTVQGPVGETATMSRWSQSA